MGSWRYTSQQRTWLREQRAAWRTPQQIMEEAPGKLFPDGIPSSTAYYYGIVSHGNDVSILSLQRRIQHLEEENTQLQNALTDQVDGILRKQNGNAAYPSLPEGIDARAFEAEKVRDLIHTLRRDKIRLVGEVQLLRRRNQTVRRECNRLAEEIEVIEQQKKELMERIEVMKQRLVF